MEPKSPLSNAIRSVPKEKLFGNQLPTETILWHWITIQTVAEGSPAAEAGMRPGDELISVNGKQTPIREASENMQLTKDADVVIRVKRDGEETDLHIQPRLNPETQRWAVGFEGNELQTIKYQSGYGEEEKTVELQYLPLTFKFASGKTVEGYVDLQAVPNAEADSPVRIKKFVIFVQPETGQRYEYDILERFNRTATTVLWKSTLDTAGAFQEEGNLAIIQEVITPDSILILLHELGHAQQVSSWRMRSLRNFYIPAMQYAGEQREKAVNWPMESEDDIDAIEEILTSAFPEINLDEHLRPLRKWWQRYDVEKKKKPQNQKRLAELQREGLTIKIIGSATVRDVRLLPTVIMERDAEYAGLLGLRTIKKETGIDFTEPFYRFGEKLSEEIIQAELEGIENPEEAREFTEWANNPVDSFELIKGHLKLLGLTSACVRSMRQATSAKSQSKRQPSKRAA